MCGDCNVSLCVDCYSVFHSVKDLSTRKAELKRKLIADREAAKLAAANTDKSPSKGTKRAYSGGKRAAKRS